MKVTIDNRELLREVSWAVRTNPQVRRVLNEKVRKHSLMVMRNVKMAMPVDTGAARARWGVAGAPGGIWETRDNGLTIEHGAQLEPYEYIERLNEGSSKQAPAGFIDSVVADVEQPFEIDIENALEGLLSGATLGQLSGDGESFP
jgi:hypothetical protein